MRLEGNENIIIKKTIEFSLAIIKYVEVLEQNRKYVIAKQLLRSATSIGANVYEAQNAESKIDFIHKFKIAAKEIEETRYWLILCKHSENYPDCEPLLNDLHSIDKIVIKIITTSKQQLIVK